MNKNQRHRRMRAKRRMRACAEAATMLLRWKYEAPITVRPRIPKIRR